MNFQIAQAFAELAELDPGVFGPLLRCWTALANPFVGTLVFDGACCRRIEGEEPDRRQWTLFLTKECDFSMCVETSSFAAKWTQMVQDRKFQDARQFACDFVDLVCRSLRDGARACRASAQSAGRGPACADGVRCAAG